jgi:hypothetical protein
MTTDVAWSRPTVGLWTFVGNVEQPEDLSAWGAEVEMVAAGMTELGESGFAHLLLEAGNIVCSELNPRSTESPRIAHRSRCVYLCQFGEFDAEPAPIVELHQQNGMRQSELTFHHLALQHIAEESSEFCAMVRMNEQVYSWTKGCDPAHLTSHRASNPGHHRSHVHIGGSR